MTVVDSRVEDVDAGAQCGHDGVGVGGVSGLVGFAQVSTYADRREPQLADTWHVLRAPEVAGVTQLRKAVTITRGAFRGGKTWNHGNPSLTSHLLTAEPGGAAAGLSCCFNSPSRLQPSWGILPPVTNLTMYLTCKHLRLHTGISRVVSASLIY